MRRYWWILALVLVCAGCGSNDTGEVGDATLTAEDVDWGEKLDAAVAEDVASLNVLIADPPLVVPELSRVVFSISESGVIEVEGEVYECDCKVCELMRKKVMGDVERWLNEEAPK